MYNHWCYTIIIIMSCYQHGYPWPFLATSPYCSSLLAGLQGYILYPHRAAVCRFELVALLSLGHVEGSTGVHYLWDDSWLYFTWFTAIKQLKLITGIVVLPIRKSIYPIQNICHQRRLPPIIDLENPHFLGLQME